MNKQVETAAMRRAGRALSRRGSLAALGATALLAAVGRPVPYAAGKGNKNKNKNKQVKKLKTKLCKKQVAQCVDALEDMCDGEETCESAITCCGLFANCNAAAALPCIFST